MPDFPILTPTLQLGFYHRLVQAENSYLLPALLNQVSKLDIGKVDIELSKFVGNDKLAFVARKGLRGELVFPVPYILTSKPSLLGYYRLLLGFSQKEFYRGSMGRFLRLENNGVLTNTTIALIDDLCRTLIDSSWILIR
jgi:hypothetical protein